MKEKVTFKTFFSTIWRGIMQVIEWFLELIGLRGESKYAKALRIIIGTCLTIWLAAGTLALIYSLFEDELDMAIERARNPDQFSWSDEKELSPGIVFVDCYGKHDFIYNHNTGKTILKNVDWVVKSDFGDSLAVFSRKGKRGYINTKSGEIAIPAAYEKAWLFSEGLAAVQKGGKLMFIDRTGNEVLKGNWRPETDYTSPLFRDGYCIVCGGESGLLGIIDKAGEWAVQPSYTFINQEKGLWMLTDKDTYSLKDSSFNDLIPGTYIDITLRDECIIAQQEGTACRAYDYEGNLINDCVIRQTYTLSYKIGEKYVCDIEDDIYLRDITEQTGYICYNVCYGEYAKRCGLMDRHGRIITEPLYNNITAIGPDTFFCEPQGIIINGKGQRQN